MSLDPGSSAFESASTNTALASAAPVRVGGTRARAGNAMGRTRAGILEATGRAVEKYGVRRATMSDVASVAGIAKGTLYNHFRTKGDLLTAAICAGVDALADECVVVARGNGADGLSRALRLAAETLSVHPALVRVAADEPAELVRLLLPSYDGGWPVARAAISRVLLAADPRLAAPDRSAGWAPSEATASGAGPTGGGLTATEAATSEVVTGEAGTSEAATNETVSSETASSERANTQSTLEPAAGAAVADAAAVETVLRWLVSFVGSPAVPGETAAGAALLARAVVLPPE